MSIASSLPFSKLRLKDLQLLRDIASVRSLTALAHTMEASQPALSRSLRDIEDQLGVTVFSRDKAARLEPTPMGRLILKRIDLLLADAMALQNEIQTFEEGNGGHVRLGIIPYIPSLLAQTIVRELTSCSYRMTVSTYEASTDQLVDALKQHTLDAVLGRIVVDPAANDLHQEILFTQTASILLHQDSDLSRKTALKMEDLTQGEWILPPAHSPTRLAFVQAFINRGLTPPFARVETTSARLIHSLTQSDIKAISLVPMDIGRELQRLGGVRCLEFPVPFRIPSVGLIVMARRRNLAVLQHLREILHRALVEGSGMLK